ncbi:MAG: DUF58 domain-containing protein, partial [Planctomycetota bacterium]
IDAAREIAAALGYIGLVSFDTVSLHSFVGKVREERTFLRGKPQVFELLRALEEVAPGGRTDLAAALRSPLPQLKGRSVMIVVSDFYDPAYADALRGLRARRHQVHAVHLVSSEEMEPRLKGRQVLVDLETNERRDVRVTPEVLARYRRGFAQYGDEIERFCAANGVRYARVRSDASLEDRVMEIVRKGGILELR